MYELDIYTYPACCGIDPKTRRTRHTSPQGAIGHLERQTEPYAYAVLSVRIETEIRPCDWDGAPIADWTEWPHKNGTNGHHPSYVALRKDWGNLVAIVRSRYDAGEKEGGTIAIAAKVLAERHPDIQGWAHCLGWEASA